MGAGAGRGGGGAGGSGGAGGGRPRPCQPRPPDLRRTRLQRSPLSSGAAPASRCVPCAEPGQLQGPAQRRAAPVGRLGLGGTQGRARCRCRHAILQCRISLDRPALQLFQALPAASGIQWTRGVDEVARCGRWAAAAGAVAGAASCCGGSTVALYHSLLRSTAAWRSLPRPPVTTPVLVQAGRGWPQCESSLWPQPCCWSLQVRGEGGGALQGAAQGELTAAVKNGRGAAQRAAHPSMAAAAGTGDPGHRAGAAAWALGAQAPPNCGGSSLASGWQAAQRAPEGAQRPVGAGGPGSVKQPLQDAARRTVPPLQPTRSPACLQPSTPRASPGALMGLPDARSARRATPAPSVSG